jgi:hypothetical protein
MTSPALPAICDRLLCFSGPGEGATCCSADPAERSRLAALFRVARTAGAAALALDAMFELPAEAQDHEARTRRGPGAAAHTSACAPAPLQSQVMPPPLCSARAPLHARTMRPGELACQCPAQRLNNARGVAGSRPCTERMRATLLLRASGITSRSSTFSWRRWTGGSRRRCRCQLRHC